MTTDYDEVRSDVKESQDSSLEALKSASATDARSVTELDESDALDEGLIPGGEKVSEELIVKFIPQGKDEFTCILFPGPGTGPGSRDDGQSYCIECEG